MSFHSQLLFGITPAEVNAAEGLLFHESDLGERSSPWSRFSSNPAGQIFQFLFPDTSRRSINRYRRHPVRNRLRAEAVSLSLGEAAGSGGTRQLEHN